MMKSQAHYQWLIHAASLSAFFRQAEKHSTLQEYRHDFPITDRAMRGNRHAPIAEFITKLYYSTQFMCAKRNKSLGSE
jgi:hypothetical protein